MFKNYFDEVSVDKTELRAIISDYFGNQIPFNKTIGVEIDEVSSDMTRLVLKMRPDLVGNTFYNILHGGVTASVLDVAGGLAAIMSTIDKLDEAETDTFLQKLRHVGTIDIRVDFLLPGRGETFYATGVVIRHGRKVAVTRMELKNEEDAIIALGTASYIVG